MPASPKVQEPSMEEILASIRRIMADDDPPPAPRRTAEPAPAPRAADPVARGEPPRRPAPPQMRVHEGRGIDPRMQDLPAPDQHAHDPRAQDARAQDYRQQDLRPDERRREAPRRDERGQDPRGEDLRAHEARLQEARTLGERGRAPRATESRLQDAAFDEPHRAEPGPAAQGYAPLRHPEAERARPARAAAAHHEADERGFAAEAALRDELPPVRPQPPRRAPEPPVQREEEAFARPLRPLRDAAERDTVLHELLAAAEAPHAASPSPVEPVRTPPRRPAGEPPAHDLPHDGGRSAAEPVAAPAPRREAPRAEAVRADGAPAAGARRRDLLSPGVDAVVAAAFQSLGEVVLPHKERTIEDLVKEILRPMLKDWLDQHLPGIVENLVRAEIERVTRQGR